MNKCHTPIGWRNDQAPALNEDNLNYMDGCIDILDDRVVGMDTSKANQSDMLTAVKTIGYTASTGTFRITFFNNTYVDINTDLEKIAINFDYDDDPTSAHYQQIIITLDDGTYKYIDLSALITQYEFLSTSTIQAVVAQDGKISFNIIPGSVTESMLQPNFLADVRVEVGKAEAAATSAEADALVSEGFANGTQNGTPVTSGSPYYENNAKYWKEQAQAIASESLSGLTDVSIQAPQNGQALVYDATNQEWVNGDGSIIAEREVSPATKAHSVGDYINIANVTYEVTAAISIGDTLTIGTNIAVATLAEGSVVYTFGSVSYKQFDKCTDTEIAQYVAMADAGLLNLEQDCGWAVGQTHQISLSAINSSGTYDGVSWSVGESQSSQTATLVLMHKGLYELNTPVLNKDGTTRNTCSFVVGLIDSLTTKGYMNSSNTNSGSWNSCARRNWCNGGFRESIPSALRGAFKQFKTITAQSYNGSTNQTSIDYFALVAEKEVYGSTTYSNTTEAAALTQLDWFKINGNRAKLVSGAAVGWHERSPHNSLSTAFCAVNTIGNATGYLASDASGISPFGCI